MHALGCVGVARRTTDCNLVRFAEHEIECLEFCAWRYLSVASPLLAHEFLIVRNMQSYNTHD
jgi:hypothetical protein